MLTPDDADLARRDPMLPGLALLLDPEAFAARLRSSVFAAGISLAAPTYVRYKPGTSCLVAYRASSNDLEVNLYAKALAKDELAKIRKHRGRAGASMTCEPGTVVWEDQNIIVARFPNDTKVRALGRLANEVDRGRLLRKLFPKRPDFWDANVAPVAYKPERRFVARLSTQRRPLAALKCYTEIGYESAKMASKAFSRSDGMNVPQRIGKSNRHRMLAFEWLPGQLLSALIAADLSSSEIVANVGAGLAALHRQTPAGLAQQTRVMEIAALTSVAAGLDQLCPGLASRTSRLTNHFADILVNRLPGDRPIHGDFYASQVLVTSRGMSIIDFDDAVYGDPLQDVGTFLAHLEHESIAGHLDSSRTHEIKTSLLEGYRSVSDIAMGSDVELFTAMALLRLAPHAFRQREKNWVVRTGQIVDRVESLVGGSSSSSASLHKSPPRNVPVLDPYNVANDPSMPCLTQAIDARTMERLIEIHCPGIRAGGESVRVCAIRVARYRPCRRCVIEYDVEVESEFETQRKITLIGKARAKGADKKSHSLVTDLRAAGLTDESACNVSIPEPVGIIPELKLWLQKKVPGRPATDLLIEADGITLAVSIANAIHTLHRLNVVPFRKHTMNDELRVLHERLTSLADMKPQWSKRLHRVLDACDRLSQCAASTTLCGIHRDFYADHVIVDGPRLWLIDFDLYCQGEGALDVGNFQGHLIEQSLRSFGHLDALADRQAALENRYSQLAGETAAFSARVYTTLTLVRHIYISTIHPERRKFTEPLLELCEDRLAASSHG